MFKKRFHKGSCVCKSRIERERDLRIISISGYLNKSNEKLQGSKSEHQFSSVIQSCPTLCDPMDCSTPGFPIHHQLPELIQTHVHRVGDAIQPSHPLLSPSPPTFNLSQHQGLFKWVSSSHQVANVLEFLLQHQSFQWVFRTDFLLDGLLLLVVAKQLFLFCLNCMSSLQLKQKLHLLSNVLFPSSPYFN